MPRLQPTIHEDFDLLEQWKNHTPVNKQMDNLVTEYRRLIQRSETLSSNAEKRFIMSCIGRIKTNINKLLNSQNGKTNKREE